MSTGIRKCARLLASLGLVMVAFSASADCNRTARPSETVAPVVKHAGAEAAVSMSDPALDGQFARYADLHRDAVGYAVVDVVESAMYANAMPATPTPITR